MFFVIQEYNGRCYLKDEYFHEVITMHTM